MNLFLFIILLFTSFCSNAQSSLNAGGTSKKVTGVNYTYSLGQPFGAKVFLGERIISEGVQQPIEVFRVVSGLIDLSLLKFDVFPNPTDEFLNVQLDHPEFKGLNIKMVDLNGKELMNHAVTQEAFLLDVKKFPSAIYFLELYKFDVLIGSYKIIKN